MLFYQQEEERLAAYARKHSLSLKKVLGSGQDGIVYLTDLPSAVKALSFEELYERERNAYQRLQSNNVERIGIFNIPSLIGFDDDLWIVEMSFVTIPFVLDFAGAYVDQPPRHYWEPQMEAARTIAQTDYSEYWADVAMLVDELRSKHGIFLSDIHPRNIRTRDLP